MNYDELEQAWRGLGERLDRCQLSIDRQRRRDALGAARARLRLLSLGQLVQLAIGVLIVLSAGSYWWARLDQPHLAVYGIAIHLYGLGLLVAAGTQLAALVRIDYRAPVLAVQRQLLALRRLRVTADRWLLIAGFVVWVPFVFALLAAAGLDVWSTRPAVVGWNLAAGLALAALVGWLTLRFRTAFERDAAGRSLRDAQADLAEFEGAD
ncbi:MAG TPA: hypothetical protein VMR06_14140 [Dokdonella sp.]|uniref:hypothetical protein n=1 Tax=Dokdonella sp. TaxID=2291710 RepID=UPI002C20EEDF|nr:hypothetical protein [Dokdonella sp.]HUD43127.1 hypothetical protein [Dokdonella sp.]